VILTTRHNGSPLSRVRSGRGCGPCFTQTATGAGLKRGIAVVFWYPTMKLFHQPSIWRLGRPYLEEVATDLVGAVCSRTGRQHDTDIAVFRAVSSNDAPGP